jgi:hypothetical protein
MCNKRINLAIIDQVWQTSAKPCPVWCMHCGGGDGGHSGGSCTYGNGMPCWWKNARECNLFSNKNIVFNYPKIDCSRSYLLATPPVPKAFPRLAAILTTCSTRASASCTLHSTSSTAASSQQQYPAPCDGGGYYHPNSWMKIISEVAMSRVD